MAKHTPGPWRVLDDQAQMEDYQINIGALCALVIGCAFTCHSMYAEEWESANARLMAAAPELYAALSALVAEVCDLEAFERFAPFVEAAEDALRKAESG